MKTTRLFLAFNLMGLGILTAGPAGLILAIIGGGWVGVELMRTVHVEVE